MAYLISTEENNASRAAFYKESILQKFGESDIAKSLRDPSFMGTKQAAALSLNQFYDQTQKMVEQRQFEQALSSIQTSRERYQNSPLKPRFALLEAMCIGGTKGEKEYINALKSITASFPNTPEEKQAKEMLKYLTGESSTASNTNPNSTSNTTVSGTDTSGFSLFERNMNTGHYLLIAFDDKNTNTNNFRDKIADYNKKEFDLLRLNVSALLLDGDQPTLIVRKFKDGTEAMNYYRAANGNVNFLGQNAPKHRIVVIGQNNYKTVLEKQKYKAYIPFFERVYLR
jgi:hypothetical protein